MSARHAASRRKAFHDQRRRERVVGSYVAMLRRCCPSARTEGHTAACVRQPGRCGDKVAMDRDAARGNIRGLDEWGAYRCDSCGFWHIGHASRPSELAS